MGPRRLATVETTCESKRCGKLFQKKLPENVFIDRVLDGVPLPESAAAAARAVKHVTLKKIQINC